MKNYDEMTDSEIDTLVMASIHGDAVKYWCLSDDETFIYDCGTTGDQFYRIDIIKPCSNPSHAWPIIVDNNISIVKLNNTEWMATWSEYGRHMAINDIDAVDKNPLRAAMICYLKMKDDE